MDVIGEFIHERNMMYRYFSLDVMHYPDSSNISHMETCASYERILTYVTDQLERKKRKESIHIPFFYSREKFEYSNRDLSRDGFILESIDEYEDSGSTLYTITVKWMYNKESYSLQARDLKDTLIYYPVA